MTKLFRGLRYLQWLWCLPLTLLGLPLWLHARWYQSNQALAGVLPHHVAPVFIAYSPLIAWLLQRHPYGPMQAMALGACVLARDAHTLHVCLAHELVHVEQALRWGPCVSAGLCGQQHCRMAARRLPLRRQPL